MKCPVCNTEMAITHTDVTENTQTGDKYNRTILNCATDDNWVTVESPQKSGVTVKV